MCSKEVAVEQNSGMWIAASTISLLEFVFYSFFSTFTHAEGRLSSFMNSEMEQIRVQCVLDLYFVKLTSSATYWRQDTGKVGHWFIFSWDSVGQLPVRKSDSTPVVTRCAAGERGRPSAIHVASITRKRLMKRSGTAHGCSQDKSINRPMSLLESRLNQATYLCALYMFCTTSGFY